MGIGKYRWKKMSDIISDNLFSTIKQIIEQGRKAVHYAVNTAMVETYWHIGRLILENEQKGADRAEYGKKLIERISQKLTSEFGKGFSAQNLWNMRQFYNTFTSMQRELKVNNKDEILSAPRRSEEMFSGSFWIKIKASDWRWGFNNRISAKYRKLFYNYGQRLKNKLFERNFNSFHE